MNDPRLADLTRVLPDLKLATDPGDLEHYGRDWTRRWAPAPLAIAFPASIEDVQGIVRWAVRQGVAVVPSGGRTGLSGGAVAAHGEIVISLDRMNRVLAFDPIDRTLTVQPGMALEAVHKAAREHGLIYPVDFAARGSCQIGGNIATNAGGIRVIRYGNTRQWIAGLKVVTGTGELLELNRGLIKNASGYDLRHLIIGSEGTLGIVVEATLWLTSPPPPSQVMLFAVPAMEDLMRVFGEARRRLSLGAFEFFTDRALHHVLAHGAQRPFGESSPYYVVTEFDAQDDSQQAAALELFEFCLEKGWVTDGAISSSDAQAAALWRLREGITESLAAYKPYKNDVSVRISAVPDFMRDMQALLQAEYPSFDVVWFGHIGDGNLHINVLKPEGLDDAAFVSQCEHVTALLCDTLERHGGSISAEHGIGLVKKPYLSSVRSEADIALMRGIKAVWDPAGIMNPGKLL
ncbi:FAD/FMN-containing dehydrogenase [Luteibacter sp. Sphag1AF]|uniref:FAD-binding oxidoreductase n=1 Tax=Luteibacter sp. Sphag1AF TaxID=2587031 RepID=UPI00161B3392|nr:FAD-binding oxidoreductase [Luteibacter sp. Sphag1AF]MBB3228958.1 FAD/FMN-containing dehydrogenase [Luteibacter sp. Sphag1AF]